MRATDIPLVKTLDLRSNLSFEYRRNTEINVQSRAK